MEIFVRRDGSLRLKYDGEGIQLGLRFLIEGESEEEKIMSAINMFKRINERGSLLAITYKLVGGEFKPVRRKKDGTFEIVTKRNFAFITKRELLDWINLADNKTKKILKIAAERLVKRKS